MVLIEVGGRVEMRRIESHPKKKGRISEKRVRSCLSKLHRLPIYDDLTGSDLFALSHPRGLQKEDQTIRYVYPLGHALPAGKLGYGSIPLSVHNPKGTCI